jgi:hypothetical protein
VAFALTIFLSAFLLFQVQLIVAKHLLPWFGGAPAVWTTCQLFFQVSLLAGYSYAHWLGSSTNLRRQGRIHLAFLFAAVVSLGLVTAWSGAPLHAPASMMPNGLERPVGLLLLILLLTVGMPFLVLSATGPLLQRWHSHTTLSLDQTYRLYALSNAGSLLGLLSYPFGIERLLDLSQQAGTWAMLFMLFAGGCGIVAWRMGLAGSTPTGAGAKPAVPDARVHAASVVPDRLRPWLWLLLSFSSSSMFLSMTNELSLEVAAIPFLWVIPLGLYLLTFIICFDRPGWYSRRWFIAAAALTTAVALPLSVAKLGVPIPYQILAHGLFLASFCMVAHGELARLRPGSSQLTQFYLIIASGGALGGAFVGLAAPSLFPDVWEFHVAALAGWAVFAAVWKADRVSPFNTGDRWHFALFTSLVSIVAAHYFILLANLGRTALVARYDWRVPLVAGIGVSLLVCLPLWRSRWAAASLWSSALVLLVLLASGAVLGKRVGDSQRSSQFAVRDFYGVVRVRVTELPGQSGFVRQLLDGNTIHGVQLLDPLRRNLPTAYYSPSTGVAAAVRHLTRADPVNPEAEEGVHFGILGMGAGAMAGFARTGDRVRYYELNPTVIRLSTGPEPHFTFVRDCAGEVAIVAGDGRLSLERELRDGERQGFDLLAMDAFSSDAVPVHLLTEEAFRLYVAHLRNDDSILAVNITNRHLDLEPVVAAAARRLGLHGVRVDTKGDLPVPLSSSWILLTRNPRGLEQPSIAEVSPRPLGDREVPFTDQYSNLFRVLKD